ASAAAREHAAAAFEAMIQSDKFGASLDRVKIKAEVLGTDLPQPTKVIGEFGIRTDAATASVEKLGQTAPIVAGQTKSAFENMATSVSTVITNFAQDAARMLWSSDGGSFGEKAMDLFK